MRQAQKQNKRQKKHIPKKWIRNAMAMLCVFALVLQFGNITAKAASIDGGKGTLKVTSDSSYLYFSYSGEWSGQLSEQIGVSAEGAGSLGALSSIVLNQSNDGDGGSVKVLNAWYSSISGASGSVANSGKKQYYGYEKMKWSIQVPVSAYKDYNYTSMTFTWGGKSVTLPVKNGETKTEEAASEAATEKVTEQENSSESSDSEKTTEVSSSTEDTTEKETGKPESSTEVTTENPGEETSGGTGSTEDKNDTEEITEETTKDTTEETTGSSETEAGKAEETGEEGTGKEENGSGIVVSGGIQIDGMYDDWEEIPKTEITYTSNNAQCNHFGQMYTDGTYIYARFQANQLYTSRMQIQIWNLTINGQTFALQILPEKNGSIDWSTPTPTTEGHHTNLKVFIGYGNNNECDSNVVYSIYDANHAPDTPGDEIEFSFSLERLSELTGIPVDQMGTITLSNPNLGGEGVTIAGSSTGPMAGIMTAFILAAAFLKRRKQQGLQVK